MRNQQERCGLCANFDYPIGGNERSVCIAPKGLALGIRESENSCLMPGHFTPVEQEIAPNHSDIKSLTSDTN